MPELPEVETIKNELVPYITDRRITGVTLFWERLVRQLSAEEFRSRLIGRRITGIARRGKYLVISLDSDEALVIHLRMTGSLIVGKDSSEPPQYTRAIIHLDNNTRIFFRDLRKFGLMRLVQDKDSVIGELGPEPLEPDFTPEVLAKILTKRSAPIKALLIDQNVIAGIGNMYADEALFAARIHPLRPGGSLSKEEIERLHQAIRDVLSAAISRKGASVDSYIRPDGSRGSAHLEFNVAHRRGELCPRCGTPIQRIPVRNRGSYFCPKCQPAG
ncbi:MAG: bifunctional DNA-formamidopyrimidine glycosylase/DNA-(apurinic or apyrimidinic site) lyase [Chloroflexi bacterium]|nr:bifunctional DNA-formamidopyrimidine glycosylase/DNA-(apurinic or apyrimidinic site) lyase [Chloroflexota bacterium]